MPRGHAQPLLEPIAMSITDACDYAGITRSEIYRRLTAGDIKAVKSGARTLVLTKSLRQHIENLPSATFGDE